jgi:hypothetical protein
MKLLKKITNVLFNTTNVGESEKKDVYIQRIKDDSVEELFDRNQEMRKRMDIMEKRHYHRYF